MMPDFHVPFRTAYRRPYVPKGGRVQRDEYPCVAGVASVRQVARDNAALAFRIVRPRTWARFSVMPGPERDLEILSFGGRLWWQCGEASVDPETNLYRFTTAVEWRDQIGQDRDLLKILPKRTSTVDTETFSRSDLPDESGEATARVQRALHEDFIVYEGGIYSAGGVPVHVCWQYTRFSEVVVASAGADRRVADFEPLRADPGHFMRAETQLAFSEGDFWEPGKLVAGDLPRTQRRFPEIQVVDDKTIPADLADRIHIDALFRRVSRSLEWFLYCTSATGVESNVLGERNDAKRRFDLRVRTAFRGAVAPGPDDYSTSLKRLEALRALFEGRRKTPKRYLTTVEGIEKSFRELNRRNPPEEISPADLAALESLA